MITDNVVEVRGLQERKNFATTLLIVPNLSIHDLKFWYVDGNADTIIKLKSMI